MTSAFFRVLYRSGRWETVEAARIDRVLGRRSPTVLYSRPAETHRCQVCGTSGPWGPCWIAWGRWGGRHAARGEGTDIYCSGACCEAENGRFPENWMSANDEPLPLAVRREIYDLQRDEQVRRRESRNHRKVPMPVWKGTGFCKWCNDPMRPGRATMWHPECAELYLQATNSDTARRALRKRDGRGCGEPGCESEGFEVDHRVPLWSVDQALPLEDLRSFYMLGNQWLLCGPHHAAKTKREAAERAAQRRKGNA